MKPSEEDIVRAHDLLGAVVRDEKLSAQLINLEDQEKMQCVLDVLCWVLGHDCAFAENIGALELRMKALGIRMERVPKVGGVWTN